MCAHNLAKTLALIGVDRVEQATGKRTIDPLGGLVPATAGERAVASASPSLTLAAIPPLGGFVSEWFTFEALLQGFRMPTLLSQLLCALAAAALALTAGLGLLAFAKYYGFMFLGRGTRRSSPRCASRLAGRPGWSRLGVLTLFLGTARAVGDPRRSGPACRQLLGFDAASTVISHPLVLGPVFTNFSVLAPTWLSIVLPAYALLAILIVRATRGRSGACHPSARAGVGHRAAAPSSPPCSTGRPHTPTRCG